MFSLGDRDDPPLLSFGWNTLQMIKLPTLILYSPIKFYLAIFIESANDSAYVYLITKNVEYEYIILGKRHLNVVQAVFLCGIHFLVDAHLPQ